MTAPKENILYEPVSNYFLEQGFFVLSRSQKKGIIGTSEFSVKINHKARYETVDILAVKWGESGQIHSIAVECKLHGTARESAGASLDQATDYQIFFDEVYVATQKGELKDKESVLKALGIGHISVDIETELKKAEVSLPAQFRRADRFSSTQNARQVVPRAVLPLVFRDIFGLPLRYMGAFYGGLWVAKDIISTIQYNAGGWDEIQRSYFSINVEFINDLRRIVKYVDRAKLSSCLDSLGNDAFVTLNIDEVRTNRCISRPVHTPAANVNVDYLLKEIEKEVLLKGTKRKTKPHLTISCLLYAWDEQLTRQDYTKRVEEAIRKLTPLMDVFKACF